MFGYLSGGIQIHLCIPQVSTINRSLPASQAELQVLIIYESNPELSESLRLILI